MAFLRNSVFRLRSKKSSVKGKSKQLNLSNSAGGQVRFLLKVVDQPIIKTAFSRPLVCPYIQTKKLFTPGPLMVTDRVKRAMMTDLSVRHYDIAYTIKYIRESLLQIAKVTEEKFTTIPMNGSDCFVTEATLKTMFGEGKRKVVIMSNGKTADRAVSICLSACIKSIVIQMDLKTLEETLRTNKDVSGVFVVHCETSSGFINPVEKIGQLVKKHSLDIMYIVDAMTSFGALRLDMNTIDFLLGDSCKSLQGVPGIAFVIARKSMFKKNRIQGNGFVLDVGAQYDELESTGQFKFTPPAHILMAFKEALMEYSDEGGLEARALRYRENAKILKQEMAGMGFSQRYRDKENPEGFLVTSYVYPNNPLFISDEFYQRLADTGNLICPESQSMKNLLCIGSMGAISPEDIKDLCFNIRHICTDMRLPLPLQQVSNC